MLALLFSGIPMIFQIQGLFALNSITIIYLGQVQPHKVKIDYKLEVFNEFMVGLTYHLLLT